MKDPLVAVVIVTWNNEADIAECLKSIVAQTYENFQVIVVDNHSADSTTKIVQQQFPEVILLKQTQNLYYTGENNLGIDYAMKQFAADYVLILNPDTVVQKDLLAVMVKAAEQDPKVGVVGPKIKFSDSNKIYSAGIDYAG